jgi:transcriptional regulator with XRE-family HTH domain
MNSRAISALPLPVIRQLKRLGQNIAYARKRRRISTQLMADRAMISRATLRKVEIGDATVSVGIYATVLFVLGLEENISLLAHSSKDPIGQELEEERLPKRIRKTRPNKE